MAERRPHPKQLTDDELYGRWQADIQRIKLETYDLFTTRFKWREIERLFLENPQLNACGGPVYDWLFGIWSTDALMSLRRELDDQGGAINLRHMLHEMEGRPSVLTRRRYAAHLQPGDRESVRKRVIEEFSHLFGPIVRPTTDPLDDHLDPAGLRTERHQLIKATAIAFQFAQEMVAHRSPRQSEATLADINGAIDAIFPVMNRFHLLLTCKPIQTAEATLQYDFLEPFRLAWYAEPGENDLKVKS